MVVDEKSTGPFTLDQIRQHPGLTREALVWKPGLDNWVEASNLPELFPSINPTDFITPQTEEIPLHNQPQNEEFPPFNPTSNEDQNHPYRQQTEGSHQYNPYQHQHPHPHHQHHNPYQHQNNPYGPYPGYDNRYPPHDNYRPNYGPKPHTNWLPWAIITTIIGFLTSCLPGIFGIIAIVQANKANISYARGMDREGDAANANARIMTIIGLILIGIIILAYFFFSSFWSSYYYNSLLN